MTKAAKDNEDAKTGTKHSSSQERLEMAQRIAREMLHDDHRAFQVSLRNSRD